MFFSFSYKPYVAIIGDIKHSKKIKDRKEIQNKLKTVLKKINEDNKQDISAKFIITLGDEFQGLLRNGENTFHVIEEIQRAMYPVEIRFGIGVGAITTDINPEMAIGADGPGFYRARSAIGFLKDSERKNKMYSSDVRIEIDGDDSATEEMLNTIFSLLAVIKSNWTDRQREIIWDLAVQNDSQKKSAERLGITQSSVQRGLKNGNYYAYREATETIKNALKEIKGGNV